MKTPKRATNKRALVGIALGLIFTVLALYISILLLSPRLPSIPYVSASPIDLNTKDDENDNRNRIQIEKIGVEVPFYTGNEDVLEVGAWHRQPENGNPAQGGNFVLAAHRFEMGNTPGQTRTKSPFYRIDTLELGDNVRIFYEGQWYDYIVSKKYEVPDNALYIENTSVEPKLTLYSCSMRGPAAGRYVIEASPNTTQ